MRTPTEKFEDKSLRFQRKAVSIWQKKIKPFDDMLKYAEFTNFVISSGYDPEKMLEEIKNGYYFKVHNGALVLYRIRDEDDIYEANLLIESIRKICDELMEKGQDVIEKIARRLAIEERDRGIEERTDKMWGKIEYTHKSPRNLRPQTSRMRLYGEETFAPRRRAASKKRTPAVRVNVRKMF